MTEYFIGLILKISYTIGDSGPRYAEFNPEAFIKEPWNAFSSLFFLIPVFYWLWKLKGNYRNHMVIVLLLPFLFLNGVGSTLFHAFRASNLLLYMDFVPAALATLIIGFYFWHRVIGNWVWTTVVILGLNSVRFIVYSTTVFGSINVINVGYFITGVTFLLPVLIILFKTNFYKWHLATTAGVLLGLALLFRSLDNSYPIFPFGVHWLWHVVASLAVLALGFYLFHLKLKFPSGKIKALGRQVVPRAFE